MFLKFVKYSVKEYLFAYFSILFLIVYWSSAYTLPYEALRYPLIISAVAVLLIAANLMQSVVKFRRKLAAERSAGEPDRACWSCTLGITKKRAGVFVFTLLYPALIKLVGFIPLSLIYLIGVSWFLGIRNKKAMVLYAAAITLILYLIFETWLGISLPQGFLKGIL